jgi:uncharacterized transporter YbjL
MADKAAERIKLETEVLRFTSLLMVGTGGGSISLILGDPTVLRLGLAGAGFFLTLALGLVSWRQYRRLQQLVEQLQEDL